jgi:hypothetical protein
MTGVGRVEHAIILLKDRLRQLGARDRTASAGAADAQRAGGGDALQPLRELVRLGQIDEQELRRAFVRTLLADALGEELVGSIEFQSVADQVARILEESEGGSELMTRALAEQG